jgi:hypothetical protein
LAAALAILASSPVRAADPPGLGWVSGSAKASYLLETKGGPAPPSYTNDGFEQTVQGSQGRWLVSVSVDLRPFRVRLPFIPGKIPKGLGLSPTQSGDLEKALATCQRADEAVNAVLLFLRSHLSYQERPDFTETPDAVLRRGSASCVGMTLTSVQILRSLGISCREVIGLRLPPASGPIELRGGLLHAWLEVDYGSSGSAFYDAWRTCGWVGDGYILLRRGEGLLVGGLASYTGGSATCEERKDRVCYEPAPNVRCILWARPPQSLFTGTLLSGKLLGPLDAPVAGSATLKGEGSSASMVLWEGNFFFRDLSPGHYLLTVIPAHGASESLPITIHSMDKRFVFLYSRTDGGGKAGASDEPGR